MKMSGAEVMSWDGKQSMLLSYLFAYSLVYLAVTVSQCVCLKR